MQQQSLADRGDAGQAPLAVHPAGQEQPVDLTLWRERLAPYAQPDSRRALLCLATSVVPYLALSVAMYLLLGVSPWLSLALAVPTAAFLVRTFIVFHDCSHGSFLASRRANAWLGVSLGLLLYAPFLRWRHDHARVRACAAA